MKTIKLIVAVLFSLILINCSKDKTKTENQNDLLFSEVVAKILKGGKEIISSQIDKAITDEQQIDFDKIISDIGKIQGVTSVEVNTTGSVVLVQTDTNESINLLVFNKADNRFDIDSDSDSGKKNDYSSIKPPVKPNGSGKAIILAPFQKEFKEELDFLSTMLENAGYQTTIYENQEVTLDKVRGDFISQFDIVFISSHGSRDAKLFKKDEKAPILSIAPDTEENKLKEWNKLTDEEKNTIALMGTDLENANFAVSPEWFRITTSGTFNNAWVYLNACESTAVNSGNNSFVTTFHDLNTAGINGYSNLIAISLANAIAEKATGDFTSGENFNTVYQNVIDDPNIIAVETRLKRKIANLFKRTILNRKLFTAEKQIEDPFYLVFPEDKVGTATITPNSGPEDTEVIFKVVIEPNFIDKVDSITFDIDTTNQTGFVMEKVSDDTWEYTGLNAPDGVYPRIDTFAFTAFDVDNNVLGKGSAAFSFSSSSSGKNSITNVGKWSK